MRSVLISLFGFLSICSGSQFARFRENHSPTELTDQQIIQLSHLTDINHIEEILDNILIPRVVGTPNHKKVADYITKQLETYNFTVETDSFTANTPNFGRLTFKNIIATLNPNAERYLVLACHYDSKYFKNENFVGATDSAVPCAMMLNLIKVMGKQLKECRDRTDLSLKLIFFDGEEAFVEWGPEDSIYGARHLAEKYHKTKLRVETTGETVSDLDRIDLLVLLDLLGAKNPTFYSSFRNTDKWYVRLVLAEERLAALGEFEGKNGIYFKPLSSNSFIEDDHIPFLRKKVPILHLIATPFPKSWHTTEDNRDGIDLNTVENLNKILRIFVTEYLRLSANEDAKRDNEGTDELTPGITNLIGDLYYWKCFVAVALLFVLFRRRIT